MTRVTIQLLSSICHRGKAENTKKNFIASSSFSRRLHDEMGNGLYYCAPWAKAGASNLFQPRAKFAVPKVWRAKIYRWRPKKSSSLRLDQCFQPKSRWRPKKDLKKRILWYFSATHNVSAEASINQPTQKPFVGHFKTFGGPLLARGPRDGRPWAKVLQLFPFKFFFNIWHATIALASMDNSYDITIGHTCDCCECDLWHYNAILTTNYQAIIIITWE